MPRINMNCSGAAIGSNKVCRLLLLGMNLRELRNWNKTHRQQEVYLCLLQGFMWTSLFYIRSSFNLCLNYTLKRHVTNILPLFPSLLFLLACSTLLTSAWVLFPCESASWSYLLGGRSGDSNQFLPVVIYRKGLLTFCPCWLFSQQLFVSCWEKKKPKTISRMWFTSLWSLFLFCFSAALSFVLFSTECLSSLLFKSLSLHPTFTPSHCFHHVAYWCQS